MPYLRYQDYVKTIQDVNLQQIIANDDTQRTLTELAAQETAIEHLTAKYDTDKEFTDTTIYNRTTIYFADDLVELNYPVYVPATSYVIGNLVTNAGKCYNCTTNTTGAFNSAHWNLLGNLYDLFYVTMPKPEFNYKKYYNIDDQVFWKNKTYTCKIQTQLIYHEAALQFPSIESIPIPNVFPDDPVNGVQYWGVGVNYSVAAATLPTDTTKWTKGDNRSQSMVRRLVQICLYYLHDRLAQRNIPELRKEGYAEAMAWLDMAKEGQITVDIPLLQPKIDGRIRYGGEVKRINIY
jgi:hypothetical protein